jgi:glycosyltransferase involved in cell wall biosynthesis
LQDYADKLGLERVVFHGQQDPVRFYRQARLLLLTSEFEGFGMVLVEAQAFGCVPIAFECFSAIGEIIENHRSGFIVDRGDTESFVTTLDAAMRDQASLDDIALQAVNAVKKFSSEKVSKQWLSVFREAL